MWLQEESRRQCCERLLLAKMHELGRKPTFDEVKNDPNMPDPNDYSFYYRSFDEAVDLLWLTIEREKRGTQFLDGARQKTSRLMEKGGEVMAKQTQKVWPHTPEELLDLAVQKCIELGRLPSARSWRKDNFFDAEEIRIVLGKGDWNHALNKIALAWDHQTRQLKQGRQQKVEPAPCKNAKMQDSELEQEGQMMLEKEREENVTVTKDVSVEVVTEELHSQSRKQCKQSYSIDDLKEALLKIRDWAGVIGVPTQKQINQAARELGTPAYATFLKMLGSKSGWAEFLGIDEAQGPEKLDQADKLEGFVAVQEFTDEGLATKKEPTVVEQSLVICAAQVDFILNGQKMCLKVSFGKE